LEDWEIAPEIGANLDELRGELNNRRTALEGKERIINALTYRNFMQSNDIKVRFIPTGKSKLMYYLTLAVQGTPENEFVQDIRLQLTYDSSEDGIIFSNVVPN
jgi:hypothetical protein